MSNNTAKKAELAKRLKGMELELKKMSKQFKDLKRRTAKTLNGAMTRSDKNKIEALRKKMGLK